MGVQCTSMHALNVHMHCTSGYKGKTRTVRTHVCLNYDNSRQSELIFSHPPNPAPSGLPRGPRWTCGSSLALRRAPVCGAAVTLGLLNAGLGKRSALSEAKGQAMGLARLQRASYS